MGFELDKEFDRPIYSPVCTFCRHLGDWGLKEAHCAAFGDEPIPDEIWSGRNKHLESYPGDRGVRFEAAADVKPEVLAEHGLLKKGKTEAS